MNDFLERIWAVTRNAEWFVHPRGAGFEDAEDAAHRAETV